MMYNRIIDLTRINMLIDTSIEKKNYKAMSYLTRNGYGMEQIHDFIKEEKKNRNITEEEIEQLSDLERDVLLSNNCPEDILLRASKDTTINIDIKCELARREDIGISVLTNLYYSDERTYFPEEIEILRNEIITNKMCPKSFYFDEREYKDTLGYNPQYLSSIIKRKDIPQDDTLKIFQIAQERHIDLDISQLINENTQEEIIEGFCKSAKDIDFFYKNKRVLSLPTCPTRCIEQVMEHIKSKQEFDEQDKSIILHIVKNQDIYNKMPGILSQIKKIQKAHNKSLHNTLLNLAANKSAKENDLISLSKYNNVLVNNTIVSRDDCPGLLKQNLMSINLYNEMPAERLFSYIKKDRTSKYLNHQLLTMRDSDKKTAALQCALGKGCPNELAEKILAISHMDKQFLDIAIENKVCSRDIANEAAMQDNNIDLKISALKNGFVSEEVLRKEYFKIKESFNKKTIDKKEEQIFLAIAANKSCPKYLIDKIYENKEKFTYPVSIENSLLQTGNCSSQLLEKIYENNPMQKIKILQSPYCSINLIEKILKESNATDFSEQNYLLIKNAFTKRKDKEEIGERLQLDPLKQYPRQIVEIGKFLEQEVSSERLLENCENAVKDAKERKEKHMKMVIDGTHDSAEGITGTCGSLMESIEKNIE